MTINPKNAVLSKIISDEDEVSISNPLPVNIVLGGGGGGGGGTGTEYIEDSAAPANPTGGVLMGVRRDTLSASEVSADGDMVAIKATNKGQLHVYAEITGGGSTSDATADKQDEQTTLLTSQLAALNTQITNLTNAITAINAVTTAVGGTTTAVGNTNTAVAATTTAVNNVKTSVDTVNTSIAANTSEVSSQTAVLTSQSSKLDDQATLLDDIKAELQTQNAQIATTTAVNVFPKPDTPIRGMTAAMTGTTSTQLVAAGGTGVYNYITAIVVSNTHATVNTEVVLQDGNAGTAFFTLPGPALAGSVIALPTPLRQPTSNTALYCACLTTGASVKVSFVGYQST